MALAVGSGEVASGRVRGEVLNGATLVAGSAMCSMGAGAIHAVGAGRYSDHRVAASLLVVAAAFQIVWGIAALLRPSRDVLLFGAFGQAAVVGAWIVTRLWGLDFIGGLEARQPLAFADATAASLSVIALGTALSIGLAPRLPAGQPTLGTPALLVMALALPAMTVGPLHDHTGPTSDLHDHAANETVAAPQPQDPASTGTTVHDHTTAVAVPPRPYDPELPIDLSGVDGVSPQQQARAENLIAVTLARLPRYADPATAEADGYRSIGDGLTGYEHYINWSYINDERILDPDVPESLVYHIENGQKSLVSAMYMLPDTYTLETVPDVGGTLTQWHIHDNLCFIGDPNLGDTDVRVAGLTNLDGSCTPPLVKLAQNPMLHVWIVPHPCGPFAALEGIGAGQILDGEQRWCDHAHGA
jgi:hypothetical protein